MSVPRADDIGGEDPEPRLLDVVQACLATLDEESLSERSAKRLQDLIVRFAAHVERGYRCATLAQVTEAHVRSFLASHSGGEGSRRPAVATMHLRRSAVRLLFRAARRLGFADHDPSIDLTLPPRSSLPTRPLTDDEVEVCRSYALPTLEETRQPAAWALAEATARTSEIPRVRATDVDLEAGRVRLPGSGSTLPRWGILTPWGRQQLTRRLSSFDSRDDVPLIYSGQASGESGQVSSCSAISAILRRAGLHCEPDVRPASVVGWAGARAFAHGAGIDEVARLLGVRSLDRAARIIGWDWAAIEQPEL